MKNIFTILFLIGVITGCRKDNSTFVGASNGSAKGANCLIVSAEKPDGSSISVVKYQLDSIMTSITYADSPDDNEYLKKETVTTFLYSEKSEELKNVKYRVYLNSFGAVEKEVAVTLNSDNKTFTEIPNKTNIYSYNAKQQLIKMSRKLNPDDGSFFELTYDAQNRVNKILVYDKEGGELYFKYDNFTFSSQPKKDNLSQIAFDDTFGIYFVPSIRNVYITHYETSFIAAGTPPDTYDFDFKFNKDGGLVQLVSKYVVFGFPLESTANLTFSCK